MPDDLINRTGRVINAPNGLRLRSAPVLDNGKPPTNVITKLFNGTTFRIKSVSGKFWYIYVPTTGMAGYVWKEEGSGEDVGKHYVELLSYDAPLPADPPYTPYERPKPYEPAPRNDRWGWIVGIGLGAAAIVAGLFSCGGPA